MGRSYLGWRESQIILFCSYGEMLSRIPDKVSRSDVDFVKCRQKFVLIWDICAHVGQKLSRLPRSRLSASEISYSGKRFVSFQRNVTFHIISKQLRRDLACKLVEMFSR